MLNKKEIIWIIIAIIIFEFVVFFPKSNAITLELFLIPIIIILLNIFTKKFFSKYYNIKIEHKIFEFQRYGITKRAHFKKPFPIGLLFPLLTTIISFGLLKPLTLLQFEMTNVPETRLLRKRGHYRKTEINESDPAMTAVFGFYSLFLLAIISSVINYPELAKFSIFYGFWNLIPFGNLDGTKIFFGSFINWLILAILFIISLIIILV
jgi:hypothetical protein